MRQKKWREEDLKAGAGQGQTALGAGGLFGGYRGRLTQPGEQPEKAQGARVWTAQDIAQLRDGPSGDRPVREPGGFTLPRAETKSLERAERPEAWGAGAMAGPGAGLSKGGAAWRPDSIGTALRPRPQAAAAPLRWDGAPYGQGAAGERKAPYLREEQKNILRNRLYDKGFTSSLAEEALAVLEDTRQSPDILFGKAERPGGSKPAEGQEYLSKGTPAKLWKEDISNQDEGDRQAPSEETWQLPPAVIKEGKRWHHPESQINQEFSEEVWRDVMKDVDGIFEELGLEKAGTRKRVMIQEINTLQNQTSDWSNFTTFLDLINSFGTAAAALMGDGTQQEKILNAVSSYIAGQAEPLPTIRDTWGKAEEMKRMKKAQVVINQYDFLMQSEYQYLLDDSSTKKSMNELLLEGDPFLSKAKETALQKIEELLNDQEYQMRLWEEKGEWYVWQWRRGIERILEINRDSKFYDRKLTSIWKQFEEESDPSWEYNRTAEEQLNRIIQELQPHGTLFYYFMGKES